MKKHHGHQIRRTKEWHGTSRSQLLLPLSGLLQNELQIRTSGSVPTNHLQVKSSLDYELMKLSGCKEHSRSRSYSILAGQVSQIRISLPFLDMIQFIYLAIEVSPPPSLPLLGGMYGQTSHITSSRITEESKQNKTKRV